MIRSKLILATAAAMLALPVFDAIEARAGDFTDSAVYCHWDRQQAWNTGDEYWWDRWRQCLRGGDWDGHNKSPIRDAKAAVARS